MIRHDHKERMLEPRLLAHVLKEPPQGMIGIAQRFVDRQITFRERIFILRRHLKRMMARSGEDRRHERFLHRAHRIGIVLQERFVPDRPSAVVLRLVVKLRHAIVRPESRRTGICLKSHASVGGAVEERRGVAFLA